MLMHRQSPILFFRSFVANTLVNAGWDVHYLPSVNFEKLYNDKNKKHSEK